MISSNPHPLELIFSDLHLEGFPERDIQVSYQAKPLTVGSEPTCSLLVGDNLDSLLRLQGMQGKVDLCYIDPPYNTGNDFIYCDRRISKATGPFGKHSAWMAFMLPRLWAAKEHLKDTGVMAISIDDYEQPYLRILMDTLFGENNLIANITVYRSKNGMGSKQSISNCHEYLLIYGKTKAATLRGEVDDVRLYDQHDAHGHFRVDGMLRKKGQDSLRADRPNLFYPLYYSPDGCVSTQITKGCKEVLPRDSKGVDRRWIWSKEFAHDNAHHLKAGPSGVIYVKTYFNESKRKKVKSVWNRPEFYTSAATQEHTALFGSKIFDTPKALEYIKKIIDISCGPEGLILDFFAGSGTTAHAAHALNELDGGSRRTILMETGDAIEGSRAAFKEGYFHINEITEARLNLAGVSSVVYRS